MTFILVPKHGGELQVNGWNWRPTLELLQTGKLLDEELYQRMGAQGCGAAIDGTTAERFADAVDAKLHEMHPHERMLADLTVTSRPKDGRIDSSDTYSATYEWLKQFSAFCRQCGGFEVV